MKNILLCVLGVSVVILALFLWKAQVAPIEYNTVVVTDTVYVDKIVIDTIPKLVYQKELKIIKDTLLLSDSKEPVEVDLPIEQKIYNNKIDSVEYTAYVSGYRCNLDSISFNLKYPVITSTITKTIKEKNRFNIGIGVNMGYDPINKNFGIMVGVGFYISK